MNALTKLAADTIHGVHRVDELRDAPMSFEAFRESLRSLPEGETVYMVATESEVRALEDEYGVH